MQECRIFNPPTVYELEKTRLWGEAGRQRRPIGVNDFAAPSPWKKGHPEGHFGGGMGPTVPDDPASDVTPRQGAL